MPIRNVFTLLAIFSSIAPRVANAATTSGSGALALAAIVARSAPGLGAADKAELARLFDGNVSVPSGPIKPHAAKIVCRSSNVAIASRECTLTFAMQTITITGRQANELAATMLENGVESQGAAGSIYVGLHGLTCTVTPAAIKRSDGSGASCTFSDGP
jgi:hypothetical protein